jgi:hypothetical protein
MANTEVKPQAAAASRMRGVAQTTAFRRPLPAIDVLAEKSK